MMAMQTPTRYGGGRTGNLDVLGKIELLTRYLARLKERFSTEKDLALEEGSRDALLGLRERSREVYQPEARKLEEEALLERRLVQPDEPYAAEAEKCIEDFRKKLHKALACFVGTPSRLLRNAETVARLAPGRKREAGRRSHEAGPGRGGRALRGLDPDTLVPTDPAVECPVCGEVLFTDAGMTLLVCPACGARESLE